MPHDKHGKKLEVGDEVIVKAKVVAIHAGEEYCNVNVKTIEPMYPADTGVEISLNTKQVEKV